VRAVSKAVEFSLNMDTDIIIILGLVVMVGAAIIMGMPLRQDEDSASSDETFLSPNEFIEGVIP
jgi:hypothetical protein